MVSFEFDDHGRDECYVARGDGETRGETLRMYEMSAASLTPAPNPLTDHIARPLYRRFRCKS